MSLFNVYSYIVITGCRDVNSQCVVLTIALVVIITIIIIIFIAYVVIIIIEYIFNPLDPGTAVDGRVILFSYQRSGQLT